MDGWIVQCFTSLPTQYRLYGRRFLQVKRPNQQYQSTERKPTKEKSDNANNKIHICIHNHRWTDGHETSRLKTIQLQWVTLTFDFRTANAKP